MQLYTKQFNAMGGPCEISIWAAYYPEQLFALAINEAQRLEKKYSIYLDTSIISQINRSSDRFFSIDEETMALFNYAHTCYEQSDGLFDVTSGVLKTVWDFKCNVIPKQSEIEQCLSFVGFNKLTFNGSAIHKPEGMQIDFGGIVKEYAADCIANILLIQAGADLSALVNMAGDVFITNPQPDNQHWQVAITHPQTKEAIALLPVMRGAVTTSGDYERFIEINNERFSHLLNPKTGWPIKSPWASVSVVATKAIIAGSASSIAMLYGEFGKNWLDELELPYLMVDQSFNCIVNKQE
ncbi:FAD:protein FMN transferase [Marinicellulosiphila megalodicopiae]|uniref:FAD:protein FMN transferase n=1 Tax=Marinicellulosiphila megalodicopiae TaxID=2724896 RepID=UPI003BAE1A35